jgi:hypothetical protein
MSMLSELLRIKLLVRDASLDIYSFLIILLHNKVLTGHSTLPKCS